MSCALVAHSNGSAGPAPRPTKRPPQHCWGGRFVGGRWRVGFSENRCGVDKIVEGFAGVEVQAVKQIEKKYEEMDKA